MNEALCERAREIMAACTVAKKGMHRRPKNIARAAIIFGVSWETWTLAIRDDKNGERYRDKTF